MLMRSMMAMCLLATPAFAQQATVDEVARTAGTDYLAAEKGVGLSIGIVRDDCLAASAPSCDGVKISSGLRATRPAAARVRSGFRENRSNRRSRRASP